MCVRCVHTRVRVVTGRKEEVCVFVLEMTLRCIGSKIHSVSKSLQTGFLKAACPCFSLSLEGLPYPWMEVGAEVTVPLSRE